MKASFVPYSVFVTTVVVTVFCGSPLNKITLYGTVTLFVVKLNSYGISMQLPDSTLMCVVTLIENSMSFGVSAKESKIVTVSKILFSVGCIYLYLLVLNIVHQTFDTLKLAAPVLKEKADNHQVNQSHPCVLEELGSKLNINKYYI